MKRCHLEISVASTVMAPSTYTKHLHRVPHYLSASRKSSCIRLDKSEADSLNTISIAPAVSVAVLLLVQGPLWFNNMDPTQKLCQPSASKFSTNEELHTFAVCPIAIARVPDVATADVLPSERCCCQLPTFMTPVTSNGL